MRFRKRTFTDFTLLRLPLLQRQVLRSRVLSQHIKSQYFSSMFPHDLDSVLAKMHVSLDVGVESSGSQDYIKLTR